MQPQQTDEVVIFDTFSHVFLGEVGGGDLPFTEITPPESVSWLPTTPGWQFLLGLLLLYLAWLAGRKLYWFWDNRHRYQALRELNQLRQSNSVEHTLAIVTLLKRVALASFSRREVAGLHGKAWFDFLSSTGPADFESVASRVSALPHHIKPEALDENEFRYLVQQSSLWIKKHDPLVAKHSNGNQERENRC